MVSHYVYKVFCKIKIVKYCKRWPNHIYRKYVCAGVCSHELSVHVSTLQHAHTSDRPQRYTRTTRNTTTTQCAVIYTI